MNDNKIFIKNPKIKIGFSYTDQFGNHCDTKIEKEVGYGIHETSLDALFKSFNTFLKQCGFVRENDYILTEDITEEEYDLLYTYLYKLRRRKDEKGEDNE